MGETKRGWFESINQNAWQDLGRFFFLIMKVIYQMLRHHSPPFTSYLSDSWWVVKTKRSSAIHHIKNKILNRGKYTLLRVRKYTKKQIETLVTVNIKY